MEEYIRVSAKTVEDAIIEASIQLGTSSDNVEYRVIEKETKGFLGIGAKKAVIEARKKKSDEDIINEIFGDKKDARAGERENRRPVRPVRKETVKKEYEPRQEEKKTVKETRKPEREAKPAREFKKPEPVKTETRPEPKAEVKPEIKPEVKPEVKPAVKPVAKAEAVEVVSEGKTPQLDFKEEDFVSRGPKTPVDPREAEQRAKEFLESMFTTMGMKVEVTAEYKDDTLSVDMAGEDMGVLIGKRGQTLDSIQYLVSLVVNKGKSSYIRVKLDTENYRERRKATLENLAKNIAFKVKKTRRPVYLEPMNPYERRIIHSALQNDPYVTTHSEGEEPCRKVVVTLKKRERGGYQNRISRDSQETASEE